MEGAPTAAFSPEAARRARDRVLRPLAADLAGRARELSLALQERVRARAPELFPDPEAAEANRASAEATIRVMGELLSSGERAGEIELPPETAAYTRMGARAGIPAISLLRLYRLGQAALWELVLPELARRADDPEQLAVAVRGFSESTFDYIDAAAILAERVYTAERERFVRSAAAARAETVATLLGGRHVDAGLASRRLGYPLERTHVGAVAWVESGSDEALTMTQLEAAID